MSELVIPVSFPKSNTNFRDYSKLSLTCIFYSYLFRKFKMSSLPNLKKLRQIANETDKMLKKSPLRDRTVTFQHNTSTSSHLEEV